MIEIENKLNLISLKDTESESVKDIVIIKPVTISAYSRVTIDSNVKIISPVGLVATADADNDENENDYIIYCDSNVEEDSDDIVLTIFNLTDTEIKFKKNTVIGKLYFYRDYDNITPIVFEHNGIEIVDKNDIIKNISTAFSNDSNQIIIDLK